MIPWMREKFAERRARWLAARNKRATVDDKDNEAITATANNSNIEVIAAEPNERQRRTSSTLTNGIETAESATVTASPTCRSRFSQCAAQISPVHRARGGAEMVDAVVQQLPSTTPPPLRRVSKIRSRRCSCDSISNSSPQSSTEAFKHPKEKLKIRIICPSARVLIFKVDLNKRLVDLKNEIILELSDDPASMPYFATDVRAISPRYRLFRSDFQGTELIESFTLAQLGIQDNDTLVLVGKRSNLQQNAVQQRAVQPPREFEVEEATRNVQLNVSEMPLVDINEIFQQSNLQFDVRKVLISLAQASAYVIGSGPYASRLVLMLKQKLINKRSYQNDTLQCLVEMGFSREKAEYALKLHHGVYSTALEWLLLRQSDDMSLEEAAMGLPRSNSLISPSGIITNETIADNTRALLEIVRIYSHRDIPPSTDSVKSLTDMGFAENDVLEALKRTCNNKAAACEWLCGNRTGSLVELREGLAADSPILKTILDLPQVQMNLGNPKILLAFLSILENEHSIRVWGGDNDTTSVITHILQKYHEEKHVLGLNQFYSDRL